MVMNPAWVHPAWRLVLLVRVTLARARVHRRRTKAVQKEGKEETLVKRVADVANRNTDGWRDTRPAERVRLNFWNLGFDLP